MWNTKAFVGATGRALKDLPAVHGFPTTAPVYGVNVATGAVTLLADNWADLMDNTIKVSLNTAFGLTGTTYFASGSTDTGDLSGSNCNDWTSSSDLVLQTYSAFNASAVLYFDGGTDACDATGLAYAGYEEHLLAISFKAP